MESKKTPSAKGKKGEVSFYSNNGKLAVNFPRQFFAENKQQKRSLGVDYSEANCAKYEDLRQQIGRELRNGKLGTPDGLFNEQRWIELLEEYGLRAKLRVVTGGLAMPQQPPPDKPEASLLEIWDDYCEWKFAGKNLAITTYKLFYKGRYQRALTEALEKTDGSPNEIRNWLLKTRSLREMKNLLSALAKAYDLAIRNNKCAKNPYSGMALEVESGKRVMTIDQNKEVENDDDVLDPSKAFSWDEALAILDYIQNSQKYNYLYSFIKFKFLTGCRSGEAQGFWWSDVQWDKECIIIQRTYTQELKVFKPTKNETRRIFPMPKGGELWNLLKSMPQGEPNEVVFKDKRGKIIIRANLNRAWYGYNQKGRRYRGIIPTLIEQGKVKKYLPCYNTRHTFITHQIHDLGRSPEIVNAWCEHSPDVSRKHYQDIQRYAQAINPEVHANAVIPTPTNNEPSEVDLLKQQLEAQSKQMEAQNKQNELLAKQVGAQAKQIAELMELIKSLQQ